MNIEQFKDLDFNRLPGIKAQLAYAPPNRNAIMPSEIKPRKAAILLLIYESENGVEMPCILRNTYKGVHSNQIGFPGGKPEEIDLDLKETAIRESFEEIYALPQAIQVLGKLTPLYIPASNFEVHPFVGIYNSEENFKPNDHEVQKIIPLQLKNYVGNSSIQNHIIHLPNKTVEVPGFKLESGEIMWGASSMIFNEFLTLVNNSLTLKIH